MLTNGVLAGFPVLGMKAVLVDGAYHDVDSSVMAFEIAGRAACREGLRKAGARLMEPIMQVSDSGYGPVGTPIKGQGVYVASRLIRIT